MSGIVHISRASLELVRKALETTRVVAEPSGQELTPRIAREAIAVIDAALQQAGPLTHPAIERANELAREILRRPLP